MVNKDNGLRVCPTRIDASLVLFSHKVASSRCQERQRKGYHKCFTCAYNNNYVDKHGLPSLETQPQALEPEESAVEAS